MSWLFKSLQSDAPDSPPPQHEDDSSTNRDGGVKDDLSHIGERIGRQLRGVAAFLAPPPLTATERQSHPPPQSPDSPSSPSAALLGIRNDLVEIGGSFKSGLSLLSSNKAVTGISKFASNLLQFQNQDEYDDEFDGVPGITEEIVEFVKKISERAECWTEFPMSLDDDFEMSDAQKDHISAVEHLDSDSAFVRKKLQDDNTAQVDNRSTSASAEKEVTEILSATQGLEINVEENTERWLDDTDIDSGISLNSQQKIEHEEDVSFSDLEDDGNDLPSRQSASRPGHEVKAISRSGSNDWIKLNDSSDNRVDLEKARQSTSRDKDSEGESSDWLAVDEFD
ncbi:hypothetical protein Pint_13792 [Pistacia integerrima]|uniref:Uncharacterized protein n=1 Tax=Pistacia integerrima TaxID=434235 RepID=A0ACC0Y816_9ROSI|nr:hypothetical protein Pint_13792 [Pistacia integerrima]